MAYKYSEDDEPIFINSQEEPEDVGWRKKKDHAFQGREYLKENYAPSWSNLQALPTCKASTPLPALVRPVPFESKNHFIYLPDTFLPATYVLEPYVYDVTTPQHWFRQGIQTSLIELGGMLDEELAPGTTSFNRLRFAKHPDRMKASLVNAMDIRRCWELVDPVNNGLISTGLIAELLLDLIGPLYIAHNYNSYAAASGKAICQIAALINMMKKTDEINENWAIENMTAVALTGAPVASKNNVYVEYMPLEDELNLHDFRTKHEACVDFKFRQRMKNCEYLEPRPNRRFTLDWFLGCQGAPIIYGEAKSDPSLKDSGKGLGLLALLSCNQIPYTGMGLAIHSSDKSFKIIKVKPDAKRRSAKIYMATMPTFSLNHTPAGLENVDAGETRHTPRVLIKKEWSHEDQADIVRYSSSEEQLQKFRLLDVRVKNFVVASLKAIDVLVDQLSRVDLEDVKKQWDEMYGKGYNDPVYTPMEGNPWQDRTIHNKKEWVYTKWGMNEIAAKMSSATRPKATPMETTRPTPKPMDM